MCDLGLACQTITWGDQQRAFLPRVFEASAAAGYAGLEIGFRHIHPTPADQLKALLEQHGLTLAAAHIGGNLQDSAQAAGERAVIDEAIDYLSAIGVERLAYSGLRFESRAQFDRDLAMLQQAAEKCQNAGITLLYHNHDWEFADARWIMNALIERTDVGFCPDVGWVMRGLGSAEAVVPFLDSIASRLGLLHLKDFASVNGEPERLDTVMLGDGVAPLSDAVAWARSHHPSLWLVAEQDTSDAPPEEAIRTNANVVRQMLRPAAR